MNTQAMAEQLREWAELVARPSLSKSDALGLVAGLEQVADDLERPRKPQPADWVCPVCGSDQVQCQVWADANTDEIIDDTGGYRWCRACEDRDEPAEFKYLTTRAEFEAENAAG